MVVRETARVHGMKTTKGKGSKHATQNNKHFR